MAVNGAPCSEPAAEFGGAPPGPWPPILALLPVLPIGGPLEVEALFPLQLAAATAARPASTRADHVRFRRRFTVARFSGTTSRCQLRLIEPARKIMRPNRRARYAGVDGCPHCGEASTPMSTIVRAMERSRPNDGHTPHFVPLPSAFSWLLTASSARRASIGGPQARKSRKPGERSRPDGGHWGDFVRCASR